MRKCADVQMCKMCRFIGVRLSVVRRSVLTPTDSYYYQRDKSRRSIQPFVEASSLRHIPPLASPDSYRDTLIHFI